MHVFSLSDVVPCVDALDYLLMYAVCFCIKCALSISAFLMFVFLLYTVVFS